MLSRRNIRIKVMQTLYAASRDIELDRKSTERTYRSGVAASFELYLFHLYSFITFLKVSKEDAKNRSAKHLPNAEDKLFTEKIYNNPLIHSLLQSAELKSLFDQKGFSLKLELDIVRKVYKDYSETDEYRAFIIAETLDNETYMKQLLTAYKYMAKHEHFADHTESMYSCWIDDKSLILGTMKKTIKLLPAESDFFRSFIPPAETVDEFGTTLMNHVLDEDAELLATIDPVLENWDASRVAILDMIFLKMAVCEMMYFPTIPTKVTLNEFVELAKTYSTDKSKEFVNGILDKLMKKLSTDGKIAKEGRGLVG